jgi:hypothetical protein
MMGFWVCVAAMVMTGWIVYAATYRAAYHHGVMDANQQWRHELHKAQPTEPAVRYIAARFSAGMNGLQHHVPAGTKPCYPQDCDADCEYNIHTATGAALDILVRIPQRPAGMTDAEVRAQVQRDIADQRPEWKNQQCKKCMNLIIDCECSLGPS